MTLEQICCGGEQLVQNFYQCCWTLYNINTGNLSSEDPDTLSPSLPHVCYVKKCVQTQSEDYF